MRSYFFIVLFIFSSLAHAESVRIQVIDVGQADGIVIRTPNKQKWIVIDAGSGAMFSNYLIDMGIESLDIAIMTHRHKDHLGGMDDVIYKLPIKKFIGVTEKCTERKLFNKVLKALSEQSVPIQDLSSTPEVHTVDGVKITIFPLPDRADCMKHENLNSIVMRLDYEDFSMLFTGDAEKSELTWLVNNYKDLLDVDILKASHHGSNNGYTDDFLDVVSPERVIISAGVNKKYKHPMKQAVEKYLSETNNRVYCTNRQGSIRVYGYKNGNSRIYKQNKTTKSCIYDGTLY